MTEYAPAPQRSGQDYNAYFPNAHVALSHYSNSNGLNYLYCNGPIQYQTMSSSYAPTYIPSQSTPATPLYMPATPGLALQYQSTRHPTLPSQARPLQRSYYSTPSSGERNNAAQQLCLTREVVNMDQTEEQNSPNADTMLSEPMVPPIQGYPDVHEFDELMRRYVEDLSPKKQDKALIHARRAENIRTVLIDKKTTSVESAQFRFWVKKMFTLQPSDPSLPDRRKKICHEGKPVAVREKLFKILTRAHKHCQHGGRDKTSAMVRKTYSWVPKELISRFVKLCPTCQVRRGTNRNSPLESERSPEEVIDPQSPEIPSCPSSRKNSSVNKPMPTNMNLPLQTAGFTTSSTFEQQNRWMTPLPPQDTTPTRRIRLTASNGLNDHEGYNTIPPMPMNCTNATPPCVTFSSIDPFGNGITSSTAYTSDSVSQVSHGHIPPSHRYGVKVEQTYM